MMLRQEMECVKNDPCSGSLEALSFLSGSGVLLSERKSCVHFFGWPIILAATAFELSSRLLSVH